MKKILLLSSLRTGSSFLSETIMLSMKEKYNHVPLIKHYTFTDKPPTTDVVNNSHSILKISWHCHLDYLGSLSNYDTIFLKRKDKFAQCLSMATAHDYSSILFNVYKENQIYWNKWLSKKETLNISKSAFCLAFWGRESFEKKVLPYLSKFKTIIEVDYEDIDQNTDRLAEILNRLDLPDHLNHDHSILPFRRNWNIWSNIGNKEEVLDWAEELFSQEGYKIDEKYY